MPQQLSQQQLSTVLRRAAELERRRNDDTSSDDGTITDKELAELVRELGIPEQDVARALTELRSGMLPATEHEASLVDRAVGPTEVVSERIVRGDLAATERRVNEFLRAQLLEIKRDFGDRIQWGSSTGFLYKARRALDFSGKITLPAEVMVESLVAPLPGESGKVIVRLVLRTGELRRKRVLAMGGLAAAGVSIAVAGVAAATGTPELLAVAGGAALAVGGGLGERSRYQRTVASATAALERFLDALEHRTRRAQSPSPT